MILLYLSGACFLAFVYPYIIYPLILRLLRKDRDPARSRDQTRTTTVALMICAHNEELALPAKIRNLRDIKENRPDLEIRVYTDGCTDDSVALLREASDILVLHEGLSRVGKATGMRMLVNASNAEILIFTDANVTVDPKSILRLISYFYDPQHRHGSRNIALH